MNIVFSSRVPSSCREALEDLLFFNPRQHRDRTGILHSLEKFGHPRLEENSNGLEIRVGDHETQSLFAYDSDRRAPDPVGVIVFLRTAPSEIGILHVAVHPTYNLRGKRGGVGLGAALVEQVKEIAARIVGIDKIIFFYRQEVVIPVR